MCISEDDPEENSPSDRRENARCQGAFNCRISEMPDSLCFGRELFIRPAPGTRVLHWSGERSPGAA